MNNQAIIAKIDYITEIPKADNIVCASVLGNNVIVHKNSKVGDIGIYFQPDLQLSDEFAKANDLIRRKNPETGAREGGFFEENRKVRAQPFLGVKSNGFFCPIDYLTKTIGIEPDIKIGEEFDIFAGIPICGKYYSPATLARIKSNKQRTGPDFNEFSSPGFLKHKDTDHFFKNWSFIPVGSILHVTEKLHGTSFRFGNVSVTRNNYHKLPWYKKLLTKFKLYNPISTKFEYVNGTRNTVLGVNDRPFYQSEDFRYNAIKDLIGRLHEGEVIYGELVGYSHGDKLIMSAQSTKVLKDKALSKRYGDTMRYTYGCKEGECKLYVYRIIRVDSNGNYVEYSWPQVKARCEELGINFVPDMFETAFIYDYAPGSNEPLLEIVSTIDDFVNRDQNDCSVLDHTHIREGVVIRVEPPVGKSYWYKAKSYSFGVLEGFLKEKDDYVDEEDIS